MASLHADEVENVRVERPVRAAKLPARRRKRPLESDYDYYDDDDGEGAPSSDAEPAPPRKRRRAASAPPRAEAGEVLVRRARPAPP